MRILVLGAGLMGRGAVYDLLKNDQVESIHVADRSSVSLEQCQQRFSDPRLKTSFCDAEDKEALTELMQDVDGAFCAIHYGLNELFTDVAIATKTHMVDLGGNNDIVNAQLTRDKKAHDAGVTIIPDCGLAPGMVAVLVAQPAANLNRTALPHPCQIETVQ